MTEDIFEEYSDTSNGRSKAAGSPAVARLLAVDSGSPVSSLALAWDGDLLTRDLLVGDSSTQLLPKLDELLAETGGRLEQLDGLVGLRGPGSFTGLRVGLATLMGLHQALRIRAGTATTFEALALQAHRRTGASPRPIFAAVDALRGERFIQGFDAVTLQPLGEPEIRSDDQIARLVGSLVIGFGLEPVRVAVDADPPLLLDAEPLAPDLAAIATDPDFLWDATELTRPLYLRPPVAGFRADH